jgi:hypothetical protein
MENQASDFVWLIRKQFRSGRDCSAWIGLVPKQHSSGGKERLAASASKVVSGQMSAFDHMVALARDFGALQPSCRLVSVSERNRLTARPQPP